MINIVIPMAGRGKRFVEANYITPKPFIKIFDKSIINWSLENLQFQDSNFIFIVRDEHLSEHKKEFDEIKQKTNGTFILVNEITSGAACSVLLAKQYINNDAPLFIANCDQYVEWNIKAFEEHIKKNIDGSIVTILGNDPAFSYAKLDENNLYVCETVEKKVISNYATVGYYYWKHGRVFVESAEKMISENKRTNNEFYVCPVYNETISLGYNKITIFESKKMWSLGTPNDIKEFQEKFNGY